MATTAIDPNILKRAQAWLNDTNIDAETKTRISRLIENDPTELAESFSAASNLVQVVYVASWAMAPTG